MVSEESAAGAKPLEERLSDPGESVRVGSAYDLTEKRRAYNASRTGSAFLMSYDEGVNFKGVRGPIGNGKSVLMCMYIVHKSQQQEVVEVTEKDGLVHKVRWSKWLVVRHTFKALFETTIETWNQWFGDRTRWVSNPYEGRYEDVGPDGILTRIDFVCLASESKNIMNDLQSLELSGAWINEATQSPERVVERIFTRIGRFNPVPMGDRQLKTFHVIMDTNSPNETNWWRNWEEVRRPEGCLFFVCPPAILEETDPVTGDVRYVPNDVEHARKHNRRPAENVREIDGGYHKGLGYWTKMVSVLDDDNIRTLLMNRFGLSVAGRPVYTTWDVARHRVEPAAVPLQRGMTVVVGLDCGRTPAAVIGQMGPDGKGRIMAEVTTWDPKLRNGKGGLESMDVGVFWERKLRPALVNDFGWPGVKVICFADPAGKNYSEAVSVSAIERLRALGLDVLPCDKVPAAQQGVFDITQGNNTGIRVSCVEQALKNGLLLVSTACTMLCEGFAGKYCYEKRRSVRGDGSEVYDDSPCKGDWSHVHDGLQYWCLGVFRGAVDYTRPAALCDMGNPFGNEVGRLVGSQAGICETGFDFQCV